MKAKRWYVAWTLGVVLSVAMTGLSCSTKNSAPAPAQTPAMADEGAAPAVADQNKPATAPSVATIRLDLDRAVDLRLPEAQTPLMPVAFGTRDGKEGWVIRLPGNRPIATPAYADGVLFVGGGYGSHEFYALDARSGAVKWTYKCEDDGPTAAVVSDGVVIFDTESCEEEVLDVATGKRLWKEWLGDPLMSQPAVANGKIFMAYPGGSPRGVQFAKDPDGDEPKYKGAVGPAKGFGHRLMCQDLKTGKHLWEQDITADVVSAPVVEGDRVYVTCFDGTSFCMVANSGAIVWTKKNSGTSAPVIAKGEVIITQRNGAGRKLMEGIKRVDPQSGEEKDKTLLAAGNAPYLRPGATGQTALNKGQEKQLESSVGFSAKEVTVASPPAEQHLNIGSVAVGWSYQGPRAAYAQGNLINAQANLVNCIGFDDGSTKWRAEACGKEVDREAQMFAPPALGEKNLYLCSAAGHLMSLRQSDGKVNFMYSIKRPMGFQPTLAEGNMYMGTTDGLIVCLKTKDADASGWHMWGGNAQHNKSR